VLAAAFLGGEWDGEALTQRARRALGPRAWLRPVARAVVEAYHGPPLDRPRELARFIEVVIDGLPRRPRMPPRVLRQPLFTPAMGFRRWPVPVLDAVGDLAAFLELEPGALEWFADVRGLERVAAGRAAAPLPLHARAPRLSPAAGARGAEGAPAAHPA